MISVRLSTQQRALVQFFSVLSVVAAVFQPVVVTGPSQHVYAQDRSSAPDSPASAACPSCLWNSAPAAPHRRRTKGFPLTSRKAGPYALTVVDTGLSKARAWTNEVSGCATFSAFLGAPKEPFYWSCCVKQHKCL